MFRSRTCGICGDMNGEKTSEFKAPSNCVFLDPISFARSYALVTGQCHLPPTRHSVAGTSGRCVEKTIKPLGLITGYQLEDISSSSLRSSAESRPCTTYTTKVMQQGDEICFSVKPVPECSLECKPARLITKRVRQVLKKSWKMQTKKASVGNAEGNEPVFLNAPPATDTYVITTK